MNRQDTFDAVVERLLDGTGRAENENGFPSYCNEDGLKCAIGIFMEEGHEMTKRVKSVSWIRRKYFNDPALPEIIRDDVYFADCLQFSHDVKSNWEGNKYADIKGLRDIAKYYHLNCDVLERMIEHVNR